jgi:MFS family permease
VDTAPSLRAVLHDRGAMAVLATTFASTTASAVQATALGKLVFDMTGRALDLGFLGLAEFLPAFLLVLVTGPVADRFDRRRIVAIGLSVEFVCALGLAWYASTDPTSVVPIFVIVVVFGVGRAFVAPAARALPVDVVGPAMFPRLVALTSVSWQMALIAGPVMAGFLYVGSPVWPFVAAAGLVVAGIVAVGFVRLRPGVGRGRAARGEPQERPSLHEALEGLRFIRRTPILLGAISLDLFAVLFGGAVALLPAIAEDRLGVGAIGLGWLRAAAGIGAALMGVALALRPLRRHVGVILLTVVALFGAFTIVLGVTRSFAVAFVALMILSAADSVSVFIRATLVPLVTPDESRGRVLAVENVFIGASNELGAAESGVAGQVLGVAAAVVLGGFATLAIAVLWAVLFPALRRVDRFADATAAGRGVSAAAVREGPVAAG